MNLNNFPKKRSRGFSVITENTSTRSRVRQAKDFMIYRHFPHNFRMLACFPGNLSSWRRPVLSQSIPPWRNPARARDAERFLLRADGSRRRLQTSSRVCITRLREIVIMRSHESPCAPEGWKPWESARRSFDSEEGQKKRAAGSSRSPLFVIEVIRLELTASGPPDQRPNHLGHTSVSALSYNAKKII